MELKITYCNNFYKIQGSLNKSNLGVFQSEFKNIFDKLDNVTISIENVTSMDRYAVNAFAELHREAIARHKNLSIVGLGCKDLYNHFKSEMAA